MEIIFKGLGNLYFVMFRSLDYFVMCYTMSFFSFGYDIVLLNTWVILFSFC